MFIPVAWVNIPPNLTSYPERVNPLEAVVLSNVPDDGHELLQSVPKQSAPERVNPPSTSRREVTVKDLPIPTLPEAVKVERVVLPETERADEPTDPKIPAEATLTEAPIPTFPPKKLVPDIPRLAAEILLVTERESSVAAEETESD